MNEYEKATFLFGYLERFKWMCVHYGSLPPEEATVLYFNKIELFKLQLQQNDITRDVAERMYTNLTTSVLHTYLVERANGRLWQLKIELFEQQRIQHQDVSVPAAE
jgi:hypothetical protein